MNLVKKFALAALLASVLAINTPAGELGTPAYASPTPSPTPQGATSSDDAKSALYDYPDAVGITTETSDYLLYEALVALLSVY